MSQRTKWVLIALVAAVGVILMPVMYVTGLTMALLVFNSQETLMQSGCHPKGFTNVASRQVGWEGRMGTLPSILRLVLG